ncbi:unnamed protein product [Notodromas monacha]|uniref:EGF-like domain-containing protein n=1 Tax=Notodromas monacha TaxID=399045 RepID=A0A7R9BNF2_9CRUS|nr:unnamed protein product [Notodromas monacha]CAG0917625.1 unnamed protein product [Notodromas monacha]
MDIDECQHDVCDPDSTCVNSPGSFSCECKPGLLDSSPAAAGAKNKCMHPGCEHPWVYHNGFCYWASQETAALSDAREKCSELNATLASVLDPAENSFLGFHAVQSLTW